jgi:hypothetical protein
LTSWLVESRWIPDTIQLSLFTFISSISTVRFLSSSRASIRFFSVYGSRPTFWLLRSMMPWAFSVNSNTRSFSFKQRSSHVSMSSVLRSGICIFKNGSMFLRTVKLLKLPTSFSSWCASSRTSSLRFCVAPA